LEADVKRAWTTSPFDEREVLYDSGLVTVYWSHKWLEVRVNGYLVRSIALQYLVEVGSKAWQFVIPERRQRAVNRAMESDAVQVLITNYLLGG
jgi:hypothetical protein